MEVIMSMNWEAARERGGWRRCGPGWKAFEIAAMVGGFVIYWPLGLAVVAFKIWQRRTDYPGDLASFCTEAWRALRSGDFASGPFSRATRSPFEGAFRNWRCGGPRGRWRGPHTGNSAFDAWRDAELARLEEERRKFAAAEKEFADYMENLRQARDREEFDRFMRDRQAKNNSSDQPPGA
jgi:hypothetical protein